MQLSPSTQYPTCQHAGLCRYPWWGRRHPLQLHAETGGRRRPDHPNPQWWYRRLRSLGVLDIKDASCRQDWNGKVEWRCLTHQRNCSAVRPQKVQSTSRYPRTVRLRYSVVPLWKRKKVSAQAPRDIPGLDQVLGQPGATHAKLQETAHTFILLTPLRTEGVYNNEWRTCSLLPWT